MVYLVRLERTVERTVGTAVLWVLRSTAGVGNCGVRAVRGAVPWVLLDTAVASVGRRLALVYWPALAT